MKVLFVTQFSKISGTCRHHVLQFLPFVEQTKIDFLVVHLYPDIFFKIQMGLISRDRFEKTVNLIWYLVRAMGVRVRIILISRRFDTIFIQRDTFPVFLYWLLRCMNSHIIYQIEDPIYEISPFLNRSILHRKLLEYQAQLCRNMMHKASWVIVENKWLAVEARKYNKNVSIVQSPLNPSVFIPGPARKGNMITLGWFGSPSTAAFLKILEPVFSKLSDKYSNIRLKAVGADKDFSIIGIPFENKEWRLDEEVADLQSFDIGLMPMPKIPFTKDHLGGKMILYMMVGIPFVADDGDLNRTVATDGVHGFFVNGLDEWIDKLSLLIESSSLRSQLGGEGRRQAVAKFVFQERVDAFIEALVRVGERSRSH